MTEGVTAHNPVQETIGDFVLNQPTVPVSTLDAPAGPRRYRGGQLTITLNKTKEGHDRRQACSKSRLRICCFQLRLGPQRCQLLVRHLGTSMVIALLLRNQKKPALTVLADPLSASRLTAKAYSSSSEDGEPAHESSCSKRVFQRDEIVSRSAKRRHVETTKTARTCDRQLPSAADLLSQNHNDLDNLQVQYIPDASALAERHQGRKRQFPHVEGNFATRVYMHGIRTTLSAAVQSLQKLVPALQYVAVPSSAHEATMTQYHLSLSRTVPIKFQQIEKLISSLKSRLQGQTSFQVGFGEWKVFVNDERSRTFLAIAVKFGTAQVCAAIQQVNKAFQQHKLQLFHQEPDPHISVAWLLGDQRANLQQHLADCKPMSPSWEQTVDQILCTVGQKKYSVWSIEDLKL